MVFPITININQEDEKMSIVVKLAELAEKLGVYVIYEYSLWMDAPKNVSSSRRENYRLTAEGYKNLYYPTFEQVMAVTAEDFVKQD